MPDALSWKHQLRVVYVGETEFQKEVRLASHRDAFAKKVKQNIQNGAKSHFHLQNGLLWYKQKRLYVPERKMKDTILKECHDGPLASHGGPKHTTTLLKKSYYWPNLKDNAKEYVKTCLTCQQNRTFNNKQAGLLQLLPIPEGPWENVSMDFMVSLPPSKGFDAIMVVVDRFSKMAHFIPTKDEVTTQKTGRLFFTHVFKHHGLPKDIVSDRDPKFTSKFWRALWKIIGSELKMSTSFHPQTNGQTERVNLVIQQFLKNYVAADQQDWVDHLELVEFCYNNLEHSATGSTPFQMVTGKSPIVPMTWAAHGQPPSDSSEEVPMVTQLDEERRHLWEVAKANLEKAHKRYKDFANKFRQEVKFQEGDEVWLNIRNFWLPEGLSHKFLGPYASPFKVLEKNHSDTYKLELPENLRVHPTFHVSLLKLVSRDASRPNREHNSRPPPDLVHNEPKFEVEAVLKSRQLRGRKWEYLVKWKGYHPIEASWVKESQMEHAQEAIEEFHARLAKKRHRM